MAVSSCDSLFVKALLYTVSVLKPDNIQYGATTSCVQRERSVLWLSTGLFGKSINFVTFLFDCKLRKDDTATSEQHYSSWIVQVKSPLESILKKTIFLIV